MRSKKIREARPKYENQNEQVTASDFKARCLELIDRIQQTREEITITRYGKPVAKLVPVDGEKRSALGWMRGSVIWQGDVVSPTGVKWEAIDE
jgi:prevent-host-death family protein